MKKIFVLLIFTLLVSKQITAQVFRGYEWGTAYRIMIDNEGIPDEVNEYSADIIESFINENYNEDVQTSLSTYMETIRNYYNKDNIFEEHIYNNILIAGHISEMVIFYWQGGLLAGGYNFPFSEYIYLDIKNKLLQIYGEPISETRNNTDDSGRHIINWQNIRLYYNRYTYSYEYRGDIIEREVGSLYVTYYPNAEYIEQLVTTYVDSRQRDRTGL